MNRPSRMALSLRGFCADLGEVVLGGVQLTLHLLTAAVARELPSTLVADRPMSRNWSMPMIRSSPASGS